MEILLGGLFYRMKGTWGGFSFWTIRTFFKLKRAFYEYWTSIKIKINMACVSKVYEIKTKREQEHWLQLKMWFLLGYNLKSVLFVGEGGIKIWWGRGIFLGVGDKKIFGWWGESHHLPQLGKPCAWGVKPLLFSCIPSIFAVNILLKVGKIYSLIAFQKLFLNHNKVSILINSWHFLMFFFWMCSPLDVRVSPWVFSKYQICSSWVLHFQMFLYQ